jgi:putative phage-type endonuclease
MDGETIHENLPSGFFHREPAAEPERRQYIGGSDIGAILGVNPYKTKLDVYREKVGDVLPFAGNPHTSRGTRLEQIAAEEYQIRTGRRLFRLRKLLTHPDHPYLGGHIDRRIVNMDGIAEIKCPTLGMFSKIKREGLRADYIAQMQWYLGLSKQSFGEWIVFCADQWELLPSFRVDFDAPLFGSMVEQAATFWNEHVLKRVPPEPDPRDEAIAAELHSVGDTRIMRDDADMIAAMDLLREAKRLSSEAELIEETAKERIKELIEDKPGCYEGPGYRLYLRESPGRVTFDKKALAGAKPLDRVAVGAVLTKYWNAPTPMFSTQFEQMIVEVGRANLDLAQFDKQGKPFTSLRPYFFGGE